MDRGRSEENLRLQHDQQQPPSSLQVRPPEGQMVVNNQPLQQRQTPPPRKCPRCDSNNTKFCYYNNYSLSQPRYFCKACRRYWTHGGTLRNVPIGGGCRKSKRPKALPARNEIAGAQRFAPALSSQNLTGMISSQPFRALPTVIPPMGNPFYTGGSFLSSLSAMQSLAGGSNQGAALNLGVGGGGGSQFGASLNPLQGLSFPSLKPQEPRQFPPPNGFFPSQQGFVPPRPLSSWTQSLINTGASSSSAARSGFWSCTAGGGDQAAGPSFTPNRWSGNHLGFNPSQ